MIGRPDTAKMQRPGVRRTGDGVVARAMQQMRLHVAFGNFLVSRRSHGPRTKSAFQSLDMARRAGITFQIENRIHHRPQHLPAGARLLTEHGSLSVGNLGNHDYRVLEVRT